MFSKPTPILLAAMIFLMVSCAEEKNQSPECTIGFVQDNMEVLTGIPIYFPVNATDPDGSITSVVVSVADSILEPLPTASNEYTWETNGMEPGAYPLVATATDNEGEKASHSIQVHVVLPTENIVPCPEAITISYQGQTYHTVQVGDQCWLKENLNVTTDNSRYYDDNPGNGDAYGQLYNWEDAASICPPGWNLPTYDDWCTLVQYVDGSGPCSQETEVGTDAGFKLRSTAGWDNNRNGSNQFGFNALPGGFKYVSGNYTQMGSNATFWSSSVDANDYATFWTINTETTKLLNNKALKTEFFSVRCIKD